MFERFGQHLERRQPEDIVTRDFIIPILNLTSTMPMVRAILPPIERC